MGTLESVLISPVRPAEFVLGKLVPYVVIATGNVLMVVLVGGLLFGTDSSALLGPALGALVGGIIAVHWARQLWGR